MADLLVIVTTVPLTGVIYILNSWPWGELLCVLSEYFKDVSIGVSVFTLTALSGDRFVAICDPLRKFHSHSGKRATRITIIIAISIWILAACLGIPAIRGSYIRVIYLASLSCQRPQINLLPFLVLALAIFNFIRLHALPGQLQKIVINKETISICYPFPMEFGKNYARLIVTFRFLCYYAIPLSVIGIFYALIAKHLIYAASHVPGEIHHNAQRQVSN
jgi:bombesin-like receptor 3